MGNPKTGWTMPRRHRHAGPRSGVKTARQLLYWLAVGVAMIVAFWNMQPYIRVAYYGLVEVLALEGIAGFFANRALGLLSLLIGPVIWGLIQTAEAYPILLKHDRRLMRLLAEEADACEQLEIREGDDPALVKLKEWYNRFPLLSIRAANRASLLAYVVDALLCISVYPPVEGGFQRLVFVVLTGQWGQIAWPNVWLIVAMLFCFEMMVRFILFLGLQAYYLRRAHGMS